MLNTRELTPEEMALVAGGQYLTSDDFDGRSGADSWNVTNGFDVTLGQNASGWTFGIGYDSGSGGLNVWTTSPSGEVTGRAWDGGGSISFDFGGSPCTVSGSYDSGPGGSGNLSCSWSW